MKKLLIVILMLALSGCAAVTQKEHNALRRQKDQKINMMKVELANVSAQNETLRTAETERTKDFLDYLMGEWRVTVIQKMAKAIGSDVTVDLLEIVVSKKGVLGLASFEMVLPSGRKLMHGVFHKTQDGWVMGGLLVPPPRPPPPQIDGVLEAENPKSDEQKFRL